MSRLWKHVTLGRLACALAVVAVGAIALYLASSVGRNWTPNIATEALSLLLTIVVVDRVVARRQIEDARVRVEQALRQIEGGLYGLADSLLWDYAKLHPRTYERPPNDFRGILNHWSKGLATRDQPWVADPPMLSGAKRLAEYLEQQIQQHESVLKHALVAEGYRFIRMERMSRDMYLDERPHRDDDKWRRAALEKAANNVLVLLLVVEPYAKEYFGEDWSLDVSDETLNDVEAAYIGPY